MASTSHSDSADMCSVTESPIIIQPKSIDNSDINQISLDSDFSEGEEDLTLSRKDASQKSESGRLLFTRRFVSTCTITSVLITVCMHIMILFIQGQSCIYYIIHVTDHRLLIEIF